MKRRDEEAVRPALPLFIGEPTLLDPVLCPPCFPSLDCQSTYHFKLDFEFFLSRHYFTCTRSTFLGMDVPVARAPSAELLTQAALTTPARPCDSLHRPLQRWSGELVHYCVQIALRFDRQDQ